MKIGEKGRRHRTIPLVKLTGVSRYRTNTTEGVPLVEDGTRRPLEHLIATFHIANCIQDFPRETRA